VAARVAAIAAHGLRVVCTGARHDQTHVVAAAFETHGRRGRAHPKLHFRADGYPLEVAAEGFDEKRIALVPAVVADLVTEEAGRDADANRLVGVFE